MTYQANNLKYVDGVQIELKAMLVDPNQNI